MRCGCDRPDYLRSTTSTEVAEGTSVHHWWIPSRCCRLKRGVDDLELLCRPVTQSTFLNWKHGQLPFKVVWHGSTPNPESPFGYLFDLWGDHSKSPSLTLRARDACDTPRLYDTISIIERHGWRMAVMSHHPFEDFDLHHRVVTVIAFRAHPDIGADEQTVLFQPSDGLHLAFVGSTADENHGGDLLQVLGEFDHVMPVRRIQVAGGKERAPILWLFLNVMTDGDPVRKRSVDIHNASRSFFLLKGRVPICVCDWFLESCDLIFAFGRLDLMMPFAVHPTLLAQADIAQLTVVASDKVLCRGCARRRGPSVSLHIIRVVGVRRVSRRDVMMRVISPRDWCWVMVGIDGLLAEQDAGAIFSFRLALNFRIRPVARRPI